MQYPKLRFISTIGACWLTAGCGANWGNLSSGCPAVDSLAVETDEGIGSERLGPTEKCGLGQRSPAVGVNPSGVPADLPRVFRLPSFVGAPAAGGEPCAARLADIDGDGWSDVVTVDQREPSRITSYVLPEVSPGVVPSRLKNLATTLTDRGIGDPRAHAWFSDLALGDFFEQDKAVDIALAHGFLGEVWVLRNHGDGHFIRQTVIVPVGEKLAALTAADLDGDQHLDLLVIDAARNQLSVLLGTGQGEFQVKHHFSVGERPQALAIADMNADARLDVVVVNEGSSDLSLLYGNGDGTFTAAKRIPTCHAPRSIAAGNLDQDNETDLVVACPSAGGLQLHLAAARTPQVRGDFLSIPYSPVGVAIADLDGDQSPDIAVGNYEGRDIYVLRSQPGEPGRFAPPFAIQAGYLPTGTAPISVSTADLNRDGLPDLVSTDKDWGGIGLLMSQGR